MGFRIVTIKSRSKLDLKLNYLVCRGKVGQNSNLDRFKYKIKKNQTSCICWVIQCLGRT